MHISMLGLGLPQTTEDLCVAAGHTKDMAPDAGCTTQGVLRPAAPATPAAGNFGNCRGAGGLVPFVNHFFEWERRSPHFCPFGGLCLAIVPV